MLSKQEIRELIWKRLEEENIALFPRPVYGRIPNFKGADKAASNLAKCKEFKEAEIIKVNPDSPQYKVREIALRQEKKVLVPTPRLRGDFFLLDPTRISSSDIPKASRISGFEKYGIMVSLESIERVDFIVAGSVAVDLNGNRVGKGEGYSELEFGILRELGKVDENTPIATTVHDIQIVDEVPSEPFDVPIDIIATPTRLIRVNRKREKPKGIYLEYLSKQKIDETPFLKEYLKKRRYNSL
ncbi:5-formyltetrahydrofolate cyclo-ligase [Sulfolobus islandicus Y.G.57.14]|jgi:5-formyltetrahydrofolate cyclo-ligase|uniref:5-formyltetrahydrofolate cyclo-ligase n=4 Tax=Saccharolobus islandicus TaxID=43080 RepID=C3MQV9_SACI2|nr:5-formyltetrahydrofolate cyclo-ligase [Sulfolobus islandicus]ACP35772.1 5-formyltetrahydrofolate cyclo-ligase [Sulfolobus islandicus L.S.2.15]ACP45996.1 5-formyltetrahydrofolate cyclo-ligase [Sulfolobus islandicus Y.G.57.14]ACP48269.1 5-formyltetrahydrofolate cyclo-ligase [Sulfolobus islandicus Y.N.15.51]ADB87561.1 5-formyltetrahydrofolate cyclo-ligase [Sulfolobus islandicus L.D.8.5]PVU76806.1 5-formyltetrahydrofolate cyclo-ligase [Sulfolobus islandicus]